MQKPINVRFSFLLILLFHFLTVKAQSDSLWYNSIIEWQQEINREYADSISSPLKPEALKNFNGLQFFPPNNEFFVKSTLTLTPDAKPFIMKTSGKKTPTYVQYGVFSFKLKGQEFFLSAYKRVEILTSDEYADYLFIPFYDLTNGNETYEGGRYLDCKIQGDNQYFLDFNKAYNPYCAYNNKYSCPIPPDENFLNIRIEAGVMK